ncbi:FAS1 domain-containing protein [Amniculicola lignicola CBS 123094]|uniref:FAS1 domain-containing protein n=1 Tax=Amniculicola lignicola CBS 123094 TaxID=1392246 RepID=A0A6A5X2C0_9PLEO|nr:FAS1 domain-containing protein [Amniculicola lignicola CBS 123094]
MKITPLLAFAPLAFGLVITESSVFEQLQSSGRKYLASAQNILDNALAKTVETTKEAENKVYNKIHKAGCDVDSWLEGSQLYDESFNPSEDHPHHPPPQHGPPHHGKPKHPPHHDHKPNETIYQLISKSKYTTKLAKLIDEYDDLVQVLNGTKANYTLFAPTDAAFEKIPDHGHKPSKEFIKNVLLYHVSGDFYPAGRVLHSYTIPSLYEPSELGHAQRLTVRVTLKGPTINFYSKLVAVNIFATNGVIHGVDSILIPPPQVADIIDLLPGQFSTLDLALSKTGLLEKMKSDDYPHEGGTLFAPSNFAFQKLGPRINAFLFSKYGEKYLKALLEYHMVVNQTLYSDAFYDATEDSEESQDRPPYYHYDLPSVLGKPLAVDVARYGPFVEIKINGFSKVTIHDGVAKDGVIQVVSNVLVPPKNAASGEGVWTGEELSVEEFMDRLEPFVDDEVMDL